VKKIRVWDEKKKKKKKKKNATPQKAKTRSSLFLSGVKS